MFISVEGAVLSAPGLLQRYFCSSVMPDTLAYPWTWNKFWTGISGFKIKVPIPTIYFKKSSNIIKPYLDIFGGYMEMDQYQLSSKLVGQSMDYIWFIYGFEGYKSWLVVDIWIIYGSFMVQTCHQTWQYMFNLWFIYR